jgi:hypothetical protein
MNWRDHLRDRLLALQPASVCVLDAAADRLAGEVLPATPRQPHDPLPAQPCALALGIDVLAGLERPAAEQLIARLRLYIAPRLLLVAAPGCALDADAFRALGFSLSLADAAANVHVYDYDLATYKTVPDWLNARFWAHPERWDP